MKNIYRKDSNWNDKVELACLIILKKAENKKFARGEVSKLIDALIDNNNFSLPPKNSINAKVGNYKSVAGITNHSNASNATKKIYQKYKDFSIADLEKIYRNAYCHHDNLLLD